MHSQRQTPNRVDVNQRQPHITASLLPPTYDAKSLNARRPSPHIQSQQSIYSYGYRTTTLSRSTPHSLTKRKTPTTTATSTSDTSTYQYSCSRPLTTPILSTLCNQHSTSNRNSLRYLRRYRTTPHRKSTPHFQEATSSHNSFPDFLYQQRKFSQRGAHQHTINDNSLFYSWRYQIPTLHTGTTLPHPTTDTHNDADANQQQQHKLESLLSLLASHKIARTYTGSIQRPTPESINADANANQRHQHRAASLRTRTTLPLTTSRDTNSTATVYFTSAATGSTIK